MASAENQQHVFPTAPPPLSAGDHEMRNYYATQDDSRPTSNQTSYLTPYLGLRARLSQVWINQWTILLLLVLIRTLLAIGSLDTSLTSAKRQALSACTGVENVGSAMASMPYYMSSGVNEMTASGIEKAINGLMSMLLMSITAFEEIFVFYINMLTSTYVCLITFAVGGSLHVAIDVAEGVGNFMNSTAKGVGDEIGDLVKDFEQAMNKFTNTIEDVGTFFSGKDKKIPDLDLSSAIAKLDNLQLPSGYDKGLNDLSKNIPDFAEVHNATDTALRFPFEEVKQLLNGSMERYTMNRSIFPVPKKEKLTFCSDDDGIEDFFEDLAHVAQVAKKIFLSVLIIAAILACIPMAYREMRRWRLEKERASAIRGVKDPMDAVYMVSRPYTSTAGVMLSNNFQSNKVRTLIRWTVAYATTVPALFVLCLAIAGLLACLCQYILLKAVEKEVPALTQHIDAFADKVVASLTNASVQWANETNQIINSTNAEINKDVFGWVNTSTTAVNNTLNTFMTEMNKTMIDVFGGTVLYDPVKDLLGCLIVLKIQGIQSALTWVHDHAHVDFPMMPNDTFALGTMDKVGNETNSNGSVLAGGNDIDAGDAISSAVLFVTHALEKAVRQEAIISTCVLLIWVLIVIIGLIRACYLLVSNKGTVPPPSPTELKTFPPQDGFAMAAGARNNSFSRRSSSISSRIPTYEQATTNSVISDNSANKFNGQSYTLSPRKFTPSEYPGATSPILSSGFSPNEKVGNVGAQNVEAAMRRPTHIRASSHGLTDVVSPVDDSPSSPRRTNNTHLQDPFADHAR